MGNDGEGTSVPAKLFRGPMPSASSRTWNRKTELSGREVLPSPSDRVIECESGGEGGAVLATLADPRVSNVFEQPRPVSYVDDEGVRRQHTVDLLALMRDGTRTAILVKPRRKAETMNLGRLIQMLAAQVPRSFADRWVHLHEGKLTRDVVRRGQLILRVRLDGPASDDPAVALMAATVDRPMRIGDAVAACGEAADFWAVVRLVADGRLRVRGGTRLDLDATVEPAGETV